ncbi:MAG TPA: hypothetical protein DHV36_08080 [Desulfobacteraceae bacterium]|nr:hypothetical protein [Desulfobacteraceae bacterium]
MTDSRLYTQISVALTGTAVLLSGLGLYARATPVVLPGITFILGIWSIYFFLTSRSRPKDRERVWMASLTFLFIGYAFWFACLTGGFFSPGILLVFAAPVLAATCQKKTVFLTAAVITAAVLGIFYFGLAAGPGALNLNEHRLFFLVVVALSITAMLYFGMENTEREKRQLRDEAKTAGRQIVKVEEDARQALEVKDRFLANVSHEIRNPMNGIIGMMHVLLDSDLDREQRRNADIVYNSARALLTIVNDILDLSKIEAGKFDLDIRPFDLDIAIQDIVSLPEVQARQKGLDFNYSVDADVPRLLKGDIGRLRQIILNLTGNAIKFTEKGSVGLTITLKEDLEDRALLNFSVDDTGIGIKEEVLEELFSAFVQADASITKQYGGTGLGLSISKLMVEKMGGSIGADSIEMIGSTFWFEIPLEKQAPGEAAIDLSRIPINKRRILVVSDVGLPGRQVTNALSRGRLNYESAEDETTALQMLEAADSNGRPFHVLLFEVHETDRLARILGKRLRESQTLCTIKCILVTAVGQKGDARDFEKLGYSAYLSFPLENDILSDCIRAVFALSGDDSCVKHPIITRFTLAETRKQCCRILIVEDMETNLITAKALIGKQGYHTDAARNGAQAVEKFQNENYDLVLMDCQMPVMDGYEATRQIRAHEAEHGLSRIPVVAMTGNAFEKDRERCFAAGMDDFISKPVEPDTLARVLQVHLARLAVENANAKPAATDEEKLPDLDALLNIDGGASPDDILYHHHAQPDNLNTEDDDTEETDDLPVFDREKCYERFGDDPELVDVILSSFFEEIPELLDKLKDAVEGKEADEVKACAHALKGAAANVNAEQLRQTAFTLEKAAGQDKLEESDTLLMTIRYQLETFTGEAKDALI